MAKQKRSVFNLSHQKALTCNIGQLTPVYLEEVVPGDKFKVQTEVLLKLAELQAPVFHEVGAYMHFFYVPNRLLWPNWERFISGPQTASSTGTWPDDPTHPYFTISSTFWGQNTYFQRGSLFDFMYGGYYDDQTFGTGDMGVKFNPFPLAGYRMIWNEYFRDENLQAEVNYMLGDGDNTDKIKNDSISPWTSLLRRNWGHDYFTSALPWTQRGNPVNVISQVTGKGLLDLDTASGDGFVAHDTGGNPYSGEIDLMPLNAMRVRLGSLDFLYQHSTKDTPEEGARFAFSGHNGLVIFSDVEFGSGPAYANAVKVLLSEGGPAQSDEHMDLYNCVIKQGNTNVPVLMRQVDRQVFKVYNLGSTPWASAGDRDIRMRTLTNNTFVGELREGTFCNLALDPNGNYILSDAPDKRITTTDSFEILGKLEFTEKTQLRSSDKADDNYVRFESDDDWNATVKDTEWYLSKGTMRRDITNHPVTGIPSSLPYSGYVGPAPTPHSVTGNAQFDVNASGSVSVNDIRTAFQLQRWLERSARGGARYIEGILAHFGVAVSDARVQRPEYLGGGKLPVVISEVLGTNNVDSTTAPQGKRAGTGQSYSGAPGFKKFFEEHGFVIGVMSILPKGVYDQHIPRSLVSRQNRLDYYWPEFAHVGEQAVYNIELGIPKNGVNGGYNAFGYQPRYEEYRHHPSSVHGAFKAGSNNGTLKGQLAFWTMCRNKFPADRSAYPVLNADFVTCNDATNYKPFYVTDNTYHHFYVYMHHHVKAIRPIPKTGTPGLIDHF